MAVVGSLQHTVGINIYRMGTNMTVVATTFNRPIGLLLSRARRLLRMSQEEFGRLLAVSRKTASRYETGGSTPLMAQVMELARLVYANGDLALASELAESTSQTLESLGIVPPPKPADPFTPPTRLVVDAVVCAAADALEASPGTMRGTRSAVLAAFRRARELALSVEDVEKALSPAPSKKKG
jgi:transcriptional regulator with XRE-family HTH domain